MISRLTRHVRGHAVGYLALFAALGGSAYAAALAPKNSVDSRSIIDGQVKKPDLGAAQRWRTVRANKSSPSCTQPKAPGTFRCTRPYGEILTRWGNDNASFNNDAGFYKDPYGVVHLKGVVGVSAFTSSAPVSSRDSIFQLPRGYRPAREWSFETGTGYGPDLIAVQSDGQVVVVSGDYRGISLDGITFRACGERGSERC